LWLGWIPIRPLHSGPRTAPADRPADLLKRRRALGLLGGDPADGSNDANVLTERAALRINSARL